MMSFAARALNLVEIAVSYLLSRITRRVIHFGKPAAVSIEPDNLCNLHCPECPAGTGGLTRPRGVMQPEFFKKVIGQLTPSLSYLTLYFQGEPYLSSHFFDLVAIARSRGIFVTTSTNGHFLGETPVRRTLESGLNRLIISLDGFDPGSYAAYRKGGDFEKVTAGIRLLASEKRRSGKRTPEIILQCLVLKTNENHLDEIRKLGRSLGADRVEFKTAQFNDYRDGNPLMPETPRYSRYRKVSGFHHFTFSPFHHFVLKNPLRNACFRMWSSCVITWDGKVVPCCYDKDATHVMGDLLQSTFKEIWRGEAYRHFRKKILSDRKGIEICTNCSQKV